MVTRPTNGHLLSVSRGNRRKSWRDYFEQRGRRLELEATDRLVVGNAAGFRPSLKDDEEKGPANQYREKGAKMKPIMKCAVLVLLIPLLTGWSAAHGKNKPGKAESEKDVTTLMRRGPMKTVAVVPASPAVDQIVVSSLLKTGRFIVLEREALHALATEAGSRNPSRFIAAELLIQAAISHVDERSGGGLGVSFGGAGLLGGQSVGANIGSAKAKAVVFLRVYEPTGRILISHRAEGSASGRKLGVGSDLLLAVGASRVSFDDFKETSVGKALQRAIEKAVSQVIAELNRQPWQARVAAVDEEGIFLNSGAADGIKPGDGFFVVRVTKVITDPTTGAVLGEFTEPVGRIEVVKVADRFCVARAVQGGGFAQGDLVREVKGVHQQ